MTGLRLPIKSLEKRLRKIKGIRAEMFTPELRKFAAKSLACCIEETPVRDLGTIQKAQTKQYANRIGYIPSVHTTENPTLIVKPTGEQFLFFNGKWYRPDKHRLPDAVWSQYQRLLAEMQRRVSRIARAPFIADRAQARFLYQKSWWQVIDSLGLRVAVNANIRNAHTRRRNPVVQPPRGFAQMHGGKFVISISIRNPFLQQPSKYKQFSGKVILRRCSARFRPQFIRDCKAKARKLIATYAKGR